MRQRSCLRPHVQEASYRPSLPRLGFLLFSVEEAGSVSQVQALYWLVHSYLLAMCWRLSPMWIGIHMGNKRQQSARQ